MDPNACLNRFLLALNEKDWSEVKEAWVDYMAWRNKGGFMADQAVIHSVLEQASNPDVIASVPKQYEFLIKKIAKASF